MSILVNVTDFSELNRFNIQVKHDVSLAPLTTMKVGGAAEHYAAVGDQEKLVQLVRWCHAVGMPYFVLGGGSNILISDRGIRGLVIHNRCRTITISELPDDTSTDKEDGIHYLTAESGAAMAGAARTSVRHGLRGLEWAVSVPGTIGGAVVNNAGAHGGEIKDNLRCARLLDESGQWRKMVLDDFAYGYRDSTLKRSSLLQAGFKPVVACATFRLESGDNALIKARADEYLAHRRRTQPVEPSLGSTFVNPPGDYAGRLIEGAGLKGLRSGGVEVSSTHANFIINRGGAGSATAADVMSLIKQIQLRVEEYAGIWLETEIQLAGEWGEAA